MIDSLPKESKTKEKPCTKKGCSGTMTWKPEFKGMGSKGGPPYRPAWVCGKCGKHDYASGDYY